MSGEWTRYIEECLIEKLDSENNLYLKAQEAAQSGEHAEAVLFLEGCLMINPDNEKARSLLAGELTGMISESIDNGSLVDALDNASRLAMVEDNPKLTELINNLSESISSGKTHHFFFLSIGIDIVVLAKRAGDAATQILGKLAGPGKLLFPAHHQPALAFKGDRRNIADQAMLNAGEHFMELSTDPKDGSLMTDAVDGVDLAVTDERGNKIEGKVEGGMIRFDLDD